MLIRKCSWIKNSISIIEISNIYWVYLVAYPLYKLQCILQHSFLINFYFIVGILPYLCPCKWSTDIIKMPIIKLWPTIKFFLILCLCVSSIIPLKSGIFKRWLIYKIAFSNSSTSTINFGSSQTNFGLSYSSWVNKDQVWDLIFT